MTPLPTSMKPDAAAWVQAQLMIDRARHSAALHTRAEAVDQWAAGVFIALRDVVFHLITDQPELGRYLAVAWRGPAAQFDAIESGQTPATADANLDVLEARKMLYRTFTELGLMPR